MVCENNNKIPINNVGSILLYIATKIIRKNYQHEDTKSRRKIFSYLKTMIHKLPGKLLSFSLCELCGCHCNNFVFLKVSFASFAFNSKTKFQSFVGCFAVENCWLFIHFTYRILLFLFRSNVLLIRIVVYLQCCE